jgi:Zn-dependent M28 family amino/carboxypeptidase
MKFLKYAAQGLILGLSLTVAACDQPDTPMATADSKVDSNLVLADMLFLSDDTMGGRDTGSEGYAIAANFVANRFSRLGLKPLPSLGQYKQDFKYRTYGLKDGATLSISGLGDLTKGNDFIAYSGSSNLEDNFADTPMVFAGYGIHAPDLGWDDFEGVDVKGKVVVLFEGVPTGFATNEKAHFGRRGRAISLNQMGAAGVIYLEDKKSIEKDYFKSLSRWANRKGLRWVGSNGKVRGADDSLQFSYSISAAVATKLFEGESTSYEALLDQAEKGEFTSFEMDKTVSGTRSHEFGSMDSSNIIGYIEGSDEELKDEFVILSAHLDHVGSRCKKWGDDKEDNICNGFYDNASGVSSIIEVARVLQTMETKPRRSVLFLVMSGEERGLKGSDYFAHNTPEIIKSTVADINLDMPLFTESSTGVTAIGAPHSSMGDESAKAAKAIGWTPVDDPFPTQTLFVRSDHYNFVRQGVPAVLVFTSFAPTDENPDPAALYGTFLKTLYHSTKDDNTQAFIHETARDYVRYATIMTQNIANQDSIPFFKEGDFFGNMYGRK